MGFTVPCAALFRAGDEELPVLTAGAVWVSDAAEQHTAQAHIGNLDELAVPARAHERERSPIVGRLLSLDGQRILAPGPGLHRPRGEQEGRRRLGWARMRA
jgi:hypothetical protein